MRSSSLGAVYMTSECRAQMAIHPHHRSHQPALRRCSSPGATPKAVRPPIPKTHTHAAATSGPKALPCGPKITAQWGADSYRHGGLMSTIEHVNYRHSTTPASKASAGTPGVRQRGTSRVTSTTYYGTEPSRIARWSEISDEPSATTGPATLSVGSRSSSRDGMIKTAYPVGVPR